MTNNITIDESKVVEAARKGMDDFIQLFADAALESVGGNLTAENMQLLNTQQITLIAYTWLRNEVMDGGFVQLIHNGYGGFIFDNPFAKLLRDWGLRDLAKLLFSAKRFWQENKDEIEKNCTDEEFMALFEAFPDFDNLDDNFIENEERWTEQVARYVDENISKFAAIKKRPL